MAVPMRQKAFDPEFQKKTLEEKRAFFANRKRVWDGSNGSMIMRQAKLDTSEQREQELDRIWHEGGFAYWSSNYMDMYTDKESNDLVYAYWRDRVHQRVRDPDKAAILAPDTAPHAFGTKRVPIEQSYYDAFNLPHVSLANIRSDPITTITPEGIRLESGAFHPLDVLIFATGFDVARGSFTQISVRGRSGRSLTEAWSQGMRTQLGMSVAHFPNMLFSYGPQSPSGTCNGPLCAEIQGEWIIGLIEHARQLGKKTRVEAREEAQEAWTAHALGLLQGTLFEDTKSYFWGENVPGKKRELVYYFGGVPAYVERLTEEVEGGYKGFSIE